MALLFWNVNYEISQEEINPEVGVSCLQLYGICPLYLGTPITLPHVRRTSDFTHTISMEDVTISSNSITLLPLFVEKMISCTNCLPKS